MRQGAITDSVDGAVSVRRSRQRPCRVTSEPAWGERREQRARVEIVIPVYNEEAVLEASVRTVRRYLDDNFPFAVTVTIADNASTDDTWAVAAELADELPGVCAVRLPEKGRGRALRAVWSASEADVVAYMDVDLSTELDALLPLIAALVSGHSDVAIGSRLASGSHVARGVKREVISRCYNVLLRRTLNVSFSDAQCGFKALRAEAAKALLPLVADDQWFFDTELLVLAEVNGMRVHEVPVDWVDDPDSRVAVAGTALDDLQGVVRMWGRIAAGRVTVPGRTASRRALIPAILTALVAGVSAAGLALWSLPAAAAIATVLAIALTRTACSVPAVARRRGALARGPRRTGLSVVRPAPVGLRLGRSRRALRLVPAPGAAPAS